MPPLEENDQRLALEQENANIVLADAANQFEALFPSVKMGNPSRFSQTGEEYIEVGNDGPRQEGEDISVYNFILGRRVAECTICPNYRAAISDWFHQVEAIVNPLLEGSPTLYWRTKPEIHYGHQEIHATNGLFRIPTWRVYSRFLISSKPVIQPTELETSTNG